MRKPHPQFARIRALYNAFLSGSSTPDLRGRLSYSEHNMIVLAQVLAEVRNAPWFHDALQLEATHPHRLKRLAFEYYMENGGRWPGPIDRHGQSRNLARTAWKDGQGWAARLFVATWPTAHVTLDFTSLGAELGQYWGNGPEHLFDPAIRNILKSELSTVIQGPYWATLDVSDDGKLHLHVLCGLQPLPAGARLQVITSPEDFCAKLRYCFKSPLPIPGNARGRDLPKTRMQVEAAMEMAGLFLACREQREQDHRLSARGPESTTAGRSAGRCANAPQIKYTKCVPRSMPEACFAHRLKLLVLESSVSAFSAVES
ncbi:hypothetical protein [Deinococcus peraridilitoris]|uniref:Uncharacterized protein n=1 Tax=Deinococcus peraridilitoris (strain DSM 19664 / LMG 22246 / CIP 109416 / KR-200) TaxID=937777 RepID=L0A0K3_DEIPD|nr:hypothetical protein [Deinococcus peraridilitoris]AFZ67423.1 hypothetical protein Deipe_1919 [Deinococcus peraridilitoris DSM 19664]